MGTGFADDHAWWNKGLIDQSDTDIVAHQAIFSSRI